MQQRQCSGAQRQAQPNGAWSPRAPVALLRQRRALGRRAAQVPPLRAAQAVQTITTSEEAEALNPLPFRLGFKAEQGLRDGMEDEVRSSSPLGGSSRTPWQSDCAAPGAWIHPAERRASVAAAPASWAALGFQQHTGVERMHAASRVRRARFPPVAYACV